MNTQPAKLNFTTPPVFQRLRMMQVLEKMRLPFTQILPIILSTLSSNQHQQFQETSAFMMLLENL